MFGVVCLPNKLVFLGRESREGGRAGTFTVAYGESYCLSFLNVLYRGRGGVPSLYRSEELGLLAL